jgi:DNA primase
VDRRLPPSFIQQVQDGSDIVDVVSDYVALKKSGRNYAGLCPFHQEKRPSFTVSPEKQLFHCFGCGAGGTLFTFLMKIDGVTFPDAVRLMGKRLGLQPPAEADRDDPRARQRARLAGVLEAAAVRFHDQLLTDPRAATARAYLAGRRMSDATIEAFSLGYALPGWDALMAPLVRQGWTPQELLDAGLIVRRADGGGYYDRFRDRVIFPIRDPQGRVVGFGARVLDDSQPKYLNSPDTALYSKGRLLYGLDRARAAATRAGHLVVVEGYFDAIAAHQAGVAQVVATLGTALTAAHLQQLERLVPRVVLLFDPDPAGVSATLRTVELFLEHGMDASVATLPAGVDPDSFLEQFGTAAFEARLKEAQPLLAFAMERALAAAPHDRIDGKTAVVRALAPTFRKIASRVELDHYIGLLAQRLCVSEASLRADLQRASSAQLARPVRVAAASASGTLPAATSSGASPCAAWTGAERLLLHLWLHRRVETGQLIGRLSPEDCPHATAQALMRLIRDSADWGAADPVAAVVAAATTADDMLAAAVAHLSLLELEYDSVPQAVEECVEFLRRQRLNHRIHELEQDRRTAETQGDQQRVRELQAAILDSRRSLSGLPR